MSDISVGSMGSPTINNEFQSEALQNLDKDAFLQLLVAQMRYQNPMSPVDSQQYLAQAAQYASVEQLENMASSQAELRSMQMVAIATDLVGQTVRAIDGFTGAAIEGVVEGVRFGAEPILVVDGVEVALSSVITVGLTGAGDTGAPGETDEPGSTSEADDDTDAGAVDERTDDTGVIDAPGGTDDGGLVPETEADAGDPGGTDDGDDVVIETPVGAPLRR